jgi:hypothetical protein
MILLYAFRENSWIMEKSFPVVASRRRTAEERGRAYVVILLSRGETVRMPDAPQEPRAGYFVSSHARPAFVTDLTSQQIDDVFDLLCEDAARWASQSSQPGTNGRPVNRSANNHSTNGNGRASN